MLIVLILSKNVYFSIWGQQGMVPEVNHSEDSGLISQDLGNEFEIQTIF